ncbi:MAG: RluA family pseudouridine synthase [Bdellovibrionia bacterium]
MEKPFDTRHILSPIDGSLSEIVAAAALLPTERVIELLELGAIYVGGSRASENAELQAGTYVRVHLKPKRYPVEGIRWAEHVVYQDEHMVLVDKPKNIPVHPMVDNKIENVAVLLARHLEQPLYVTQRLDILTRGLFVLAKTKDFQRAFNGLLNEKRVEKIYSARTESPPPLGRLKHYMLESPRSPKTIALEPGSEGTWLECVLSVSRFTAADTAQPSFDAEIELITGRTHQIRAQLSFAGAPLAGDRLYGSERPSSEFQLVCKRLNFENPLTQQRHDFTIL